MLGADSNKFLPVHEMIGSWAQKTPEATALVEGSTRVSYRLFHALSNQFARFLREKHGIGRGSVVAVQVESTFQAILSITAILKAGGAYLPVDPDYPQKRRRIILSESAADLLIVGKGGKETDDYEGPILILELEDFSEGDSRDVGVECSPADPAYVIYTSGSTGTPKGVMVEHRSLSNNIRWAADYYRQNVGTLHFLLYTSLSFDGSATSYWAPLSSGGSVTAIKHGDMDALLQSVNSNQGVNALKITPSGLAALLESSITLPGIRVLIVAGEAFRSDLARRARATLGEGVAIFNSYGPSEATINCLIYRLKGDESTPIVPIGVPITGALAAVLDQNGARVVGQPGELVVWGRCLARGYHNAPHLTAEKFKTDLIAGERVYLTGDRALEDETGIFHFLGRLDSVIKLRGYRIDLEEVEHALLEGDCFEDVAVMVESNGYERLAAFVVVRKGKSVDIPRLKRQLATTLPSYMVPPIFYRIDKIIMDPHGKKDREAICNLPRSLLGAANAVAPRSESEKTVADIVATLLSDTTISINSTLLDLGVDSLLQIGIASRIEQRTGKKLALSDLRLDATLAGIARALERSPYAAGVTSIPFKKPALGGTPIPFTLSQVSYFRYLQRASARSALTWNNLYYAGRLRGALDLRAIRKAVDALVERHEMLRVAPRETREGRLEFAESSQRPKLEEIELTQLEKAPESEAFCEVISDIALNSCSIFQEKPLFRAVLAPLSENEYFLILVAHIVVCDGWSKNLLVRELGLLYESLKRREAPLLGALKTGWRDYANWERQRIEENSFQPDEVYWARQLEDHKPPQLPRHASVIDQEESAVVQIPDEIRARVSQMAGLEGASEFAFYVSCFALQLAVYTASNDIVVGALSARRTHVDFESVVGPFVGVLFLRFHVNLGASFRDNLRDGIEVCREAMQRQEVPLPLIWDALEERAGVSVSESKVRFNFGSHPRFGLKLEGLEVLPLSARYPRNETSGKFKFDIAVDQSPMQASLRYDGLSMRQRQYFLEDYLRLLHGSVATPDRPVETLAAVFQGHWARMTTGAE
jgi:amino acid adenylation domain-containing protein